MPHYVACHQLKSIIGAEASWIKDALKVDSTRLDDWCGLCSGLPSGWISDYSSFDVWDRCSLSMILHTVF